MNYVAKYAVDINITDNKFSAAFIIFVIILFYYNTYLLLIY